MVVSLVALFMSMGGVGYAAIALPANSVGTSQLRDDSVTFRKIVPQSVGRVRLADRGVTNSKIRNGAVSFKKIQPRAVGKVRANLDQLQARLASTCAAGSAIGAVDSTGKVTCNPTGPAHVGSADTTGTVGTTAAAVNTVTLPTGSSYLLLADPSVSVTSGTTPQRVTVTCALGIKGNTQSRSVTVDTSTGTIVTSLPLQVATAAGAASVSCSAAADAGTLPAVHVTTAIDALATAS